MNLARGHSLVFGAGSEGLMGASARGMKKAGAEITGVVPEFSLMTRLKVYLLNVLN